MYLTDGEGHTRRVSGGGWAVSPDGFPTSPPSPGRPLRSLLVDPDALARRHLRQLLEREPDVVVSAECEAGMEALEAVGRERPDLVFLDVLLPDIAGFTLAHELRSRVRGGVIFVTELPQGALEAFEVHALDYLLKPVGPERLHAALGRAPIAGRLRWLFTTKARRHEEQQQVCCVVLRVLRALRAFL